jgi:hypothetical protein
MENGELRLPQNHPRPPLKGYGDMKISLLFSELVWYSEMYGFERFPES